MVLRFPCHVAKYNRAGDSVFGCMIRVALESWKGRVYELSYTRSYDPRHQAHDRYLDVSDTSH